MASEMKVDDLTARDLMAMFVMAGITGDNMIDKLGAVDEADLDCFAVVAYGVADSMLNVRTKTLKYI